MINFRLYHYNRDSVGIYTYMKLLNAIVYDNYCGAECDQCCNYNNKCV